MCVCVSLSVSLCQRLTSKVVRLFAEDDTRTVDVVAWNNAAAYFHDALRNAALNTLVHITGYRLKWYLGRPEMCLNDHPAPVLSILQDASVAAIPRTRFPVCDLRLATCPELVYHQPGAGFSIAGVLTWVGPVLRTSLGDAGATARDIGTLPSTSSASSDVMQPARGPWYAYRWVTLREDRSRLSLTVRLFANSRLSRFERLVRGAPVALTYLRLCSATDAGNPPRSLYATSSNYTDIVMGRHLRHLARSYPRIHDMLQWTTSPEFDCDGEWESWGYAASLVWSASRLPRLSSLQKRGTCCRTRKRWTHTHPR